MKGRTARPIREVALGLLERRDHTAVELRRKLRARGFAQHDIDVLILRLSDVGLVDDRRTARLLIEREMAAGKAGPALIRAKLAAKGVASDVVDECLCPLDRDWELEQARAAAQRWVVRRRREGAWHAALARHLRSRGFSWDVVRRAVESSGADLEDVEVDAT